MTNKPPERCSGGLLFYGNTLLQMKSRHFFFEVGRLAVEAFFAGFLDDGALRRNTWALRAGKYNLSQPRWADA